MSLVPAPDRKVVYASIGAILAWIVAIIAGVKCLLEAAPR